MKSKVKKIIILIGILLCLCVIGIVGYCVYSLYKIRSHYGTSVVVEKGNLYCLEDRNYQICGQISSKLDLSLQSQKIGSKYFQIENSNYYILYSDATKTEKKEISLPNYVVWNQTVHTKEQTHLYQENKLVMTLQKEMSFPIFYQDTSNYYVTYLNQIFEIPKSENIEVYEEKNTDETIAQTIPVLYFADINTWKDTTQWIEQKQKLLEDGWETILVSDYQKWLSGGVQLKEHSILLLSNTETNIDGLQIEKRDETIDWKESNAVSKVGKANLYTITETITYDQFQKMLDGQTVIVSSMDQKIPVLNYHFFYDPTIGEACNENICLTTQKFEEQLQYLKENGYYTLTMEEFRDWMYGKIEVPQKSVLITVDDGAFGTGKHNGNHLITLLEKYDMHATLFLITGWWSIENYRSPNLDIESHTYDMHTSGLCPNQTNGAQMLCSSYDHVMNDLKKSIEITQSTKAFCFPFYAYNSTAIQQVKEAGFELAFIGGSYKASRNVDKYHIPRYPIAYNITMDQFIQMVS